MAHGGRFAIYWKRRNKRMPSLSCPECGKELLPQDLVQKDEHLICPKCSRKMYEREKTGIKLICPSCGEEAHGDNFLIVES
jgi:DNA-directed RNA polymerase subunit RPC12/RpoP